MLWRPTYATRVLERIALPRLEGQSLGGEAALTPSEGALLGAFGPYAGAELGVWRRLMDEAFPTRRVPTVLVQADWTPRERRAVALSIPPADHDRARLARDPAEAWKALLAPDRVERAFGAVMRDGLATLVMVGLPTEESWDRFQAELKG